MTHDTTEPTLAFDPKNMVRFYDATTLFFKRQLSPVEVVGRCGIPCLGVSESTWARWKTEVEAERR